MSFCILSPQQLGLLPDATEPLRPLDARIGAAWFEEVPETPGVYLFLSYFGRVLYVGQSASLRQRVNSYRYLKAPTGSKRHLRLIAQTHCIRLEPMPTAALARYFEYLLIRRYRPRFNRAANGNARRFREPGQLRLWADTVAGPD